MPQKNTSSLHSSEDRIQLGIVDIDGVIRGKMISAAKFEKAVKAGLGFCNVVFGWDVNDEPYTNGKVSGWQTGYPDAIASLDLQTLRRLPWMDELPFVLGDFSQSALADVCPRTLLKRVIARGEALGVKAAMAFEYEWFNFRETSDTLAAKSGVNPIPMTPGMFGYSLLRVGQQKAYVQDLWRQLKAFGVPLEGLHTETGDGVYEAAITYTDTLEAADRAVCFKLGVKQIAHAHGILPSFMAKWSGQLPGCSGHLHQSLWDPSGKHPLFPASDDPDGMSMMFRNYLAGQLYCLPRILPLFAPTINSYKRLVPGSWAATTASWGFENRTAALRVIKGEPSATRLETRVPGADANPYLVAAAALAAGLYGIRHNLALTVDPTLGNEYESRANASLPTDLGAAVAAMREAEDLTNELFGPAFTDHFLRTREWEWSRYGQAVTDWELRRYFEVI